MPTAEEQELRSNLSAPKRANGCEVRVCFSEALISAGKHTHAAFWIMV